MTTSRFLFLILTTLMTTGLLPLSAQTPVYYNRFEDSDRGPLGQLFRLTANSDTRVTVNLREAAIPALSRDGRFIAVHSVDPARPNQVSKNVFAIDLANNNSVRKITSNVDRQEQNGSSSVVTPLFKAFSPAGATLAVASIRLTTGGTQGGVSTVPMLDLHRFSDGAQGALVYIGGIREGEFAELLGLDWSPTVNQLVTPVRVSNGGNVPDVGALLVMNPVPDAVNSGQARQLTFPRSSSQFGVGFTTEHDMYPAFSPGGNQVAFFRAFDQYDARLAPNVRQPARVSLHIINFDGTGERLLPRFNPGIFPAGLSWSADGSRLVFGLGRQGGSGGSPNIPSLEVEPSSTQIFMMPSAGGDITQVPGPAGSAFGSWSFAGDPAQQPPGQLVNISTRTRVETGDRIMIGGFIVTGTQPKRLMVRAIGPSLPVAGALANPQLEIFDSAGNPIASNDDWQQSANRQEIIDSTIAPTNDREAAVLGSVNPGSYTAAIKGADGGSGVGLVEVYDLDRTVDSKLANISTRGLVQGGDDVLIGGIIVSGSGPQKVLIRAIGPSLPVSGKLADPRLELYDGNGTLLQANDNWQSDQQAEIEATTIPPSHNLESAIVRTLSAAPHTAVVRGVNGATGVALVETYGLN